MSQVMSHRAALRACTLVEMYQTLFGTCGSKALDMSKVYLLHALHPPTVWEGEVRVTLGSWHLAYFCGEVAASTGEGVPAFLLSEISSYAQRIPPGEESKWCFTFDPAGPMYRLERVLEIFQR